MSGAPFYSVRPTITGGWAVVHLIPGVGIPSIDCECPSQRTAEEEAAWRNYERAREQARAANDRRLCGVRS